jgi:hypothetical protein
MLPFVPLGPRARVAAALTAAAACGVAAIAGIAACLTAPPADVGTSTNERPLILHTSVQPPEGLLNGWPDTFQIPILLPDPSATCQWELFDRDLEGSTTFVTSNNCVTSIIDGGVIVEELNGIKAPTGSHCHVFTFIVANGFSSSGVPVSSGGDYATWEYAPPGALCNFYDAGAFQDGSFPPGDSGADVLIAPESGPIPEAGIDP